MGIPVVQLLSRSNSLWPHRVQHSRLPCPSLSLWTCSNSCPSNRWCHPTVSSSVVHFSSCLQSFPASGSFPMSQLIASGGQSIGASALVSVLPMNIQDWFPLGWTGLISLPSKGLSRVFSNITVQNYQYLFNSLQQKCNPSCWVWTRVKGVTVPGGYSLTPYLLKALTSSVVEMAFLKGKAHICLPSPQEELCHLDSCEVTVTQCQLADQGTFLRVCLVNLLPWYFTVFIKCWLLKN